MIECKICGGSFVNVNNFHLRKHGITTEKYKELYPGAPTMDASLISKRSSCGTRHIIEYNKSDRHRIRTSVLSSARMTERLKDNNYKKIVVQRLVKYWKQPFSIHYNNMKTVREVLNFLKEKVDKELKNSHIGGRPHCIVRFSKKMSWNFLINLLKEFDVMIGVSHNTVKTGLIGGYV